jgi:soluble cytochrome b562
MSAAATATAPVRTHSPPPLQAEGVDDPEVENYREALEEYIAGLSEEQALAYKVAYEELEQSYTIVRSQGFLTWLKHWQKTKEQQQSA